MSPNLWISLKMTKSKVWIWVQMVILLAEKKVSIKKGRLSVFYKPRGTIGIRIGQRNFDIISIYINYCSLINLYHEN